MNLIPRVLAPNDADRAAIRRDQVVALCDGLIVQVERIAADTDAAVEWIERILRRLDVAYPKHDRRP